MNIHILVDYSFLYYKYKFQLDSGRMRKLFHEFESNGATYTKDVSQIYYSLREIESFRKDWESKGHQVTVTVCFDMPSSRKDDHTEESDKYKSNRAHKLDENDFENIAYVQELLNKAGYNTFRIDGLEADDIITNLVELYKDTFDATVIYTPDADLIVNVCPNVAVSRYKAGKQYTLVTTSNFSDYLGAELKCEMPYNALVLYKCTVGDKSDCIDGIKGFGPAAFDKLINFLKNAGCTDFSNFTMYGAVEQLLHSLYANNYFTEAQFNQAIASLNLVRCKNIVPDVLPIVRNAGSEEKRRQAYSELAMNSLI